jgi:hypothetical protein
MDEFPPCIDCGQEEGSCPEGRCRDCDVSYVIDTWPRCGCGALLFNEAAKRMGTKEKHTATCSKYVMSKRLHHKLLDQARQADRILHDFDIELPYIDVEGDHDDYATLKNALEEVQAKFAELTEAETILIQLLNSLKE